MGMRINTGLHANGAPIKIGAPLILNKKAGWLSINLIKEIANRPALATPATSVPDPVASTETIIKTIIEAIIKTTSSNAIVIEALIGIIIGIIIAAMILTPHKVHLLSLSMYLCARCTTSYSDSRKG